MKAIQKVLLHALLIFILISPTIHLQAQLKADFTATPTSGCSPLIVGFTDKSTGKPTSWKWILGNGVISTAQYPSTTYFEEGVYTIKLIVSNATQTDSITKTGYINVYGIPDVDFDASPLSGCYPLDVNFVDKSTTNSGNINSWLWDFGDGNTATVARPVHTYTSSGSFGVSLMVTSGYGCSKTITKNNYINLSQGVTAAFAVSSADICQAPASYSFTNQSIGSGNLAYYWQFGDGATSNATSPKHNYSNPGTYTVLLTATSSSGCVDTASVIINFSFPKSAFNILPTICANQPQFISNNTTPTPVSVNWNFGDGTSSTEYSPTKTYTKAGTYQIKLVNEFSATCKDSITKIVEVIDGPAASYKASDTASCSVPFTVNFTNTTKGNAVSFLWDFGDGTTSTEINPTHTYTKNGDFTVSLTATNSNGCQTVDRIVGYIKIHPLSISGFENLPVTGCTPYIIHPIPIANASLTNATYLWDFGDGATSTLPNPSHTYQLDGDYTVSLTLTTTSGCTTTFKMKHAVVVGHKPTADFFADPLDVCAKLPITFTSTSTNGPITQLEWHFGDGAISYENPVATHKFVDTGYFTITLIAFNNGCPDTMVKERYVHIKAPVAKYTFENNCTDRQSVSFKDKSIDDKTWQWNFGDGNFSSDQNPVHTYASTGSYEVILSVANDACEDTMRKTIQVVNEKPKLSITPYANCRNVDISFEVKNVNKENIINTTWNFGDGIIQVVNSTSVMHSYAKSGTYIVSVVVQDILGCTDTLTETTVVNIYGPTAKFTSPKTTGCIKELFDFTDASTTDGTHAIQSWTWDYGDNTITTYNAAPFQHAYLNPGYYDVKLTIQDSYGCTDSIRKKTFINITKPTASFNFSDSVVCPDKKINFTSTSDGIELKYSWDFKDGSGSSNENPNHTYTVQGKYYPQLLVTDINNCPDSITSTTPIIVSIPSPKFLMSDSFSTCPPLNVIFTNKSQNYASYTWDFGDGNTSTIFSPSHLYNTAGTFQVTLKVTGNGGCVDSLTRKVEIKGPSGNISYDPINNCFPNETSFISKAQNTSQYLWDFSDGTTITTSTGSATHTYAPGTYLPKIILSDDFGCEVPIKGLDSIHVYDITAVPTVFNKQFCDSGTIIFTDSSYSNDSIQNYHWIFPDNSTADGKQVSHLFTSSGTYNISLIVTTKNGCSDTAQLITPFYIASSPKINITGDSTGCTPFTVTFKGNVNASDTSVLNWNWAFGNGAVSNLQDPPPITYTLPNLYAVSAIAKNSAGCADTAYKQINVLAPPNVSAGMDTTICKFGTYVLQPNGATSYIWDQNPFISCTTCTNPIVSPDSTMTFVVHGFNSLGCQASDSITVQVIQPGSLKTMDNDSLCMGGTILLHAEGSTQYQWSPATFLDNPYQANPVMHATKDTIINYQVTGTDRKNCFIDTGNVRIKVYPIPGMQILKENITLQAGQSVKIETTATPDITQWKWEPSTGLDNPNSANPIASPLQTTTYTCVAINGGGCIARDMVTVHILCDKNNIFIPNTFSPNNDGMNDAFYPRGTGLFSVKSIKIFNRWGELVFSNNNVQPNVAGDGWDGNYQGKKAPSDVYVYVMEIICDNSKVIPVKGNVTLIR
ncbi:MAG: PKD domain-containing protein [Bacteroidetes bacterium]|nr:PKD domain-containing protein [Bacteroidota bacterium]